MPGLRGSQEAEPRDDRLVGWKSIANFLGCDPRTAKRWEAGRGLPVRRLPGEGSATVWADRAALREWLNGPDAMLADTVPPPEADASAAALPKRRPRWIWGAAAAGTIAIAVAAGMAWTPAAPDPAAVPGPYDDDPAARALWLDARYALAMRSASGLAAAANDLEALTRRFPDRAPAYAGLADAHVLSREFAAAPDAVAFPAAASAARTALALDPDLPDARLVKAFVDFWWTHDLDGGLRGFRAAIDAAPDSAKAHHWYATAALATGHNDIAATEIAAARRLDPTNHAIAADAAFIELCAGNVASAAATLEQLIKIEPDFVASHRYLAIADLLLGRDLGYLHEAAITARLRGSTGVTETLARAEAAARSGGHAAMLASLTQSAVADYQGGKGTAAAVARLRAVAGDRAGMLRWISLAHAAHEADAPWLASNPEMFAWRNDPALKGVDQPA